MRSRRRLICLLLGLSLLLGACRTGESTEQASTEISTEASTETSPARAVKVVSAQIGTLTAQKTTTVTIEPLKESSVAAGAAGRVDQILKREGQQVAEGETIIVLDSDNANLQVQNAQLALDAARINLQKAQRATSEGGNQLSLQLQSAQTNYNVLKQQYDESSALFAAGGIAKTQLDSLQAQLTQAEATVLQLQNSLAQNQRASSEDLSLLRVQVSQAETALQQAKDALAEANVKAPFAGEISEIFTEQGEFLGAGSPAFKLVSNEQQLAKFSVPPEDAAKLTAQKEIFIRYQGLDYGASIVRSSTAPNNQRLVDLTAEIYPSDTPIPSGSVAQLNYSTNESSGLLIPASAITLAGGKNYVFVAEDSTARREEVTLLDEVSGQAIIEGLAEGSQIIHPLPNDLRDGANIRILD
ncbi:MAG: efflux RND transporter periplasmic adaptor subunit [Trueperaceae bacterium]|nr:efflux RND transporter periplasmic adaptor subunit [Trueperaceae bacterium]